MHKSFLLFLFSIVGYLNAQLNFTQLDSVLAYANKNSASTKIANEQNLLAKWTKIAAQANAINFRNPVSFSSLNNLQLPVNFIPAEAFGGAPGSLREITLGQQYVSNFNFNPQIDIINPQNLARIKSAEINKQLVNLNNQIIQKLLYESIAAAYFNIGSLNTQIMLCEKNILSADSIFTITKNKFESGISREQDLNNSKVNLLLVKDKLQQLKVGKQQQINALKVLLDLPEALNLVVEPQEEINNNTVTTTSAKLETKYSLLQSTYLKNELKANRLSMLPILSLVYNQGWQQNSNNQFFDNNAKWIPTKYIGIKITMPFPADVNKFSQNYTNKINLNISNINASHNQLQNNFSNKNLELEVQKAISALETTEQIFELKNFNYSKSMDQYREGILGLDLLLTSFNDLLNAQNNLTTAKSAFYYSQSKIKINNIFK